METENLIIALGNLSGDPATVTLPAKTAKAIALRLAELEACATGYPASEPPPTRNEHGNYSRVDGRLFNGDVEIVYWDGSAWRLSRNQEAAEIEIWWPRHGFDGFDVRPASQQVEGEGS